MGREKREGGKEGGMGREEGGMRGGREREGRRQSMMFGGSRHT